MHEFLEKTLLQTNEITLADCETFLYCLQKPLTFDHFQDLVTPNSKDFHEILTERSKLRHTDKSKQLYSSEPSFGKVIAEKAEEQLKSAGKTREELAATAIKSEAELQEELIMEEVRRYKESALQLAVAQFVDRLIVLSKQRMEARRQFLRDVRYVELSASYNRNGHGKFKNLEVDDLLHFEADFDEMVQVNFHPLKDVLV
jgi:hypothetical protein